MEINAIVLAAGKGTRMKSKYPKVIHELLKKPMILHVIDNLKKADVSNIISVVGFQSEKVIEVVQDNSEYVYQTEQLGTGHAIMMAAPLLENKEGLTIIICGDTPLITSSTLEALIKHHTTNENKATILTGVLDDALAYGRIIRDEAKHVQKIVEFKDATDAEKQVTEFNTGTYIFDNKRLFELIKLIDNNNAQNEYYLTDIISLMNERNDKVDGFVLENLDESIGINDRATLAQAQQLMKNAINHDLMMNGVTIIDPDSTYIGSDVTIGLDTVIYPNTSIYGSSTIGDDCEIGPSTELINTSILNNSKIIYSHIHDCQIKNNVKIGPYARMRQNCIIEDNVNVGNFVEFKNTKFGKASKSAHLTYIGDSVVGQQVNIGCGTITVNYDGKSKAQTTIGDKVFVGCNSNLIAPVAIADNCFVAAGTTVTEDVPKDSLVIGRARQLTKAGYYNTKEEQK